MKRLRARLADWAVPTLVLIGALALWEIVVRVERVPAYVLPAPSAIARAMVGDWSTLSASLLVTLSITFQALAAAVLGGAVLALLFSFSPWAERALLPFAVVLQVTPIVAIAPLLLVYMPPRGAVLVCAFLVAFFPILSNTALGLASVDHNLLDLFELYGASPWRRLVLLRLPAALPFFLGGLRIGGGLSLIGAIVAEIAAGSAGQGSGLAFRIVESAYRLNIPRLFAALFLISIAGLAIYAVLAALSFILLARWHESARLHER